MRVERFDIDERSWTSVVEPSRRGAIRIVLDNESEYDLTERDGKLEVRLPEGRLNVRPQAANMVILEQSEW